MGDRRLRILQAVLGCGRSSRFAARSLARNWEQLRAQPLHWQVEPGWILLSALVTWLMYALLILAWRRMLASWGRGLDLWSASRIWTVSSLGKYVPGKVWAVAGMAMMAQQAGVGAGAATGSAVILQVLAIGTGAAVAAATGWTVLRTRLSGRHHRTGRLARWRRSSAWDFCSGRRSSTACSETRRARGGADQPSGRGGGIRGRGERGGLGRLRALALAARAGASAREWGWSLLSSIAVFTVSYLAGFLALFAPGGIGVRESVFILMLQGPIGIGAATALAIASRLLLTVTELGAAVPFLLVPAGEGACRRLTKLTHHLSRSTPTCWRF